MEGGGGYGGCDINSDVGNGSMAKMIVLMRFH